MRSWFFILVLLALLVGCAPATPAPLECADPAVFCVGVVTQIGRIDDQGLNRDSWLAVSRALEKGTIQKADYIESVNELDFAKNVEYFIGRGYDLVVTVGSGFAETTLAAANLYPEVLFIGVDQPNPGQLPNLAGMTFAEDQAGFLAGSLAALVSQTKTAGAACESDYIAAMWRYCEGFRAGVFYASPDVFPQVWYRPADNSDMAFRDVQWGKTTAQALAEAGADVVFSAGGGTALAVADQAAQKELWVIGGGEDFKLVMPEVAPRLLTSLVKKVSPGLDSLLEEAAAGEFSSPNVVLSFTFSAFNKDAEPLNKDVRSQILEIEKGLASGEILTNVLPENPLYATPEPVEPTITPEIIPTP